VLDRLDRQVGGPTSGSAAYVYHLGLAGQRLVDPRLDRARRPWTPRPSWLEHALRVSELYVQLRIAERTGSLKIEQFQTEPDCWRPFASSYGSTTRLKPDAYVQLGVGDYQLFTFIEVDQGTESPRTLTGKFEVYRRYWQSGQAQAASGVFPRVLWLVPDEQRRAVLIDVAAAQPPESWRLHVITEYPSALDFMTEPP
jgi:hypothetical protein